VRGLLAAALLFWVAGGGWAVSFDEGKNAFGRQDWKSASELLTQFVQENPDDPQAVTAAFLRAVAKIKKKLKK